MTRNEQGATVGDPLKPMTIYDYEALGARKLAQGHAHIHSKWSQGEIESAAGIFGSRAVQVSGAAGIAADGALALAIIAVWRHDSGLRAEFGSVATYEAYVRGAGKQDEVLAAAAGLARNKPVTKPIIVAASHVPAVVPNVPITGAAPRSAAVPTFAGPMDAGKWLSDRYKTHHANALARGMTYSDACGEAKRLADIDRAQLRAQWRA